MIARAGIWGLVIAALAAVPYVSAGYHLALAINLLSYTVMATSWALFSGPTRYVSRPAGVEDWLPGVKLSFTSVPGWDGSKVERVLTGMPRDATGIMVLWWRTFAP